MMQALVQEYDVPGTMPAKDDSWSVPLDTERSSFPSVMVSRTFLVLLGVIFVSVFALRGVGRMNHAMLLWPVSAVGLALVLPLWHLGMKRRMLLLLAIAMGMLFAVTLIGIPWWIASVVIALTCLQVTVSASILSPAVKSFDDLRCQASILRFLATTVVGPVLTGVLGAYPIAVYLKQSWLETAQTNTLAVSLGLAVITPAILLFNDRKTITLSRLAPQAGRASAAAILFLLVASFVFWQNTSPLLFLIFPPMILLLLATGLEGAVFVSIALTAIGWIGTIHGHGPIMLVRGGSIDHLKILQLFAWVCVAAALPIGALLDERKKAVFDTASALSDKSGLAQELQASRHLFLRFVDYGPNVAFIKSEDGRYVFYNQQFALLFGISATAWLGCTDHQLFPAAAADAFRAYDRMVMDSGQVMHLVEKVPDTEGVVRSFRSTKFSYKDVHGHTLLAGVSVDISAEVNHSEEMANVNRQLKLLAITDALTGLPNRRAFESRAEVEFTVAKRKQRPLSMLIMDIDNFKLRNDQYGHAAGDVALQVLGTVLLACVRAGDIAARLGGEEFGFLLPETGADGAMKLAERMQTMLRAADHGPVPLTVSVGVATLDKATGTWQRLLAKADDAMYEAKRTGKNKSVHHTTLMPLLMTAASELTLLN